MDTADHQVAGDDNYCQIDGEEMNDDLLRVPRLNSATAHVPLVFKDTRRSGHDRFGMHVVFNIAGSLLKRHNRPIEGNIRQKHFVQSLVSTIFGAAFPILFLQAMLFPKHFWSSPLCDPMSVIGCPPISCYRGSPVHPDGFASHLERARNLCTHASSSSATDDKFTSHCWDIQANLAGSGIDSRVIQLAGFHVDNRSASGLSVGNRDKATLYECIDSSQAAMNLAAASEKKGFDTFLTYTCNQKDHPGLQHLWLWKESSELNGFNGRYSEVFPNFKTMHPCEKEDITMSMEMSYTHILSRCWLEVKALWIDFILNSTSTYLRKVAHGFFRDEYQESSGNLCHIHALIALEKSDVTDNKEFFEFICQLHKNNVASIVRGDEIDKYVMKGIIKDHQDWCDMQSTAYKVLSHTCSSKRCLVKTGPLKGQHYCKKCNFALASRNHMEDELRPFPTNYSDELNDILERIGLYTPPSDDHPYPVYHHKMFNPKRHIGAIHPLAMENMSPVLAEHFCFARSSQNAQVVTGTDGVTRYVVKVLF